MRDGNLEHCLSALDIELLSTAGCAFAPPSQGSVGNGRGNAPLVASRPRARTRCLHAARFLIVLFALHVGDTLVAGAAVDQVKDKVLRDKRRLPGLSKPGAQSASESIGASISSENPALLEAAGIEPASMCARTGRRRVVAAVPVAPLDFLLHRANLCGCPTSPLLR